MDKIIKMAQKLNDCFEYKTFDKGLDNERTITTIKDKGIIGEALHDTCIRLVYDNNKIADDYTYQWVWTALDIIANSANEDEIQEKFNEQEPSIYTSDLTAWLNSNNSRIYYIEQAISDYGAKDGFQVLSYAQYCEMQETLQDVLSQLGGLND